MSHAKIPKNCLTPAEAAQELGISSRAIYKKMRVLGWLNIDRIGNTKSTHHNTPKQWAITDGLLVAIESSYTLKGDTPIQKTEIKPAITQKGYSLLSTEISQPKEKANKKEKEKDESAKEPSNKKTETKTPTISEQKKIAKTKNNILKAKKTITNIQNSLKAMI